MSPLLKIMTENAERIGLLQFAVFMFMLWDCLTDQVEDLIAHGVSVKLCKAFQFLWVSESMRKPICLSFSIMPSVWYIKYKISSLK